MNYEEIINKINELNLERVQVSEVLADSESDHYLVNIHGGFNGRGTWIKYLDQLKQIISAFDHAWILGLEYDAPDDVWYLSLGVSR